MSYTRPQFCVPWTITAAQHLKVSFNQTGLGTGAITVTATASTAGDYYNARNFSDATELVKHLIDKLTAAETAAGTNGTWSCSETSSGDYPGIFKIKRARGHVNDVVTGLVFETPSDVPGTRFGYTANTVVPDGIDIVLDPFGSGDDENCFFTATNRAEGLWIMDNATAHYSGDEITEKSHVVSTVSPDGTTLTNNWGDISRWSASMQTLSAASIYKHYVDQAAYASNIGAPTADPNACLDTLRKLITRLEQGKYAKWYGDYTSLSSFTEIIPAASTDPWLRELREGIQGQNDQPRMFDLTLTAYKKTS